MTGEIDNFEEETEMVEQEEEIMQEEPEQEAPPIPSAPEPAPAAEPKQDMPTALANEKKTIKTVSRNMSDIVTEKLAQLKDLATMEVLLPVHTRMMHRLESIKEMSSARTIKVRGHHKTTAPAMHITGLSGRKISNDEVEITFGVYDMDENGNKKEYKNYSDVEIDGRLVKRHHSSQYNVVYEITERIRSNKPIVRESMKIDKI